MSPSVQAIVTRYETGWLINDRNVLLTEAGKSKIKVPAAQCLVRTASWLRDGTFWPCPHLVEVLRVLSQPCFLRALVPFMRAELMTS